MKSTWKHSKCNQLSKSYYIVFSLPLFLLLMPSIADLLLEYITILSIELFALNNYKMDGSFCVSKKLNELWKYSIDKRLIEFNTHVYIVMHYIRNSCQHHRYIPERSRHRHHGKIIICNQRNFESTLHRSVIAFWTLWVHSLQPVVLSIKFLNVNIDPEILFNTLSIVKCMGVHLIALYFRSSTFNVKPLHLQCWWWNGSIILNHDAIEVHLIEYHGLEMMGKVVISSIVANLYIIWNCFHWIFETENQI